MTRGLVQGSSPSSPLSSLFGRLLGRRNFQGDFFRTGVNLGAEYVRAAYSLGSVDTLQERAGSQRRVIKREVDGQSRWVEFDIIKVLADEQEAREFPRGNDFPDLKF